MTDQDFNNPNADAGEVGAGTQRDGAVRESSPAGAAAALGAVTLHWIDPQTGARDALDREITTADFGADYYRATSSFRLAATVAGFAEILRQSPYATGYTLADVEREASESGPRAARHAGRRRVR